MNSKTTKNDPINRGEEGHLELKDVIINSWLGRRDSNPRMLGPKPSALPLGHSPINWGILRASKTALRTKR